MKGGTYGRRNLYSNTYQNMQRHLKQTAKNTDHTLAGTESMGAWRIEEQTKELIEYFAGVEKQ